jgi:carbamoyltransferase
MTNGKFNNLFGGPARDPESPLVDRHMDLAASIQQVIEEIILKIAYHIKETTGEDNLCLAGGVALNCVANGKIQKEKIFKRIWIQPAAGDAGGAVGAALSAYHIMFDFPRKIESSLDGMKGSFLGPQFSQDEINTRLEKCSAKFSVLNECDLINNTAHAISKGLAVGWMNGRMEFGPRSLGNRSILADPRSPTMQRLLNLKIKFRESFRPFAPSILRENVQDYFQLNEDSPYMLLVADLIPAKRVVVQPTQDNFIKDINVIRSEIPAVTHVDYSARVQTVHEGTNSKFYKLIKEFYKLTGCPVLVNTSFNVRGEPIVCTPEDAFNCFMGTELDILVVGNAYLIKEEQSKELVTNYKNKYMLD